MADFFVCARVQRPRGDARGTCFREGILDSFAGWKYLTSATSFFTAKGSVSGQRVAHSKRSVRDFLSFRGLDIFWGVSGHTFFKRRRTRARNEKGRCGRAFHLPHSGLSFLCSSRCFVPFLSRDASLFQCLGPGSQVAGVSPSLSLKRLSWISRGAERAEQWVPEGRLINCAHTRLTFFFFRLRPMITTVCAKEMHHHPQQGCRGTAGDD